MARPRADAPGPSARERLVRAFWSMLSEMCYSAMTVTEMSARAGVNHNTFYRYHRSLDEMASSLVSDSASRGMAAGLVPAFCDLPWVDESPAALLGSVDAEHAAAVARSGSRTLVDAMCSSAMELWLEEDGGGSAPLEDPGYDELASVFWGIAAVAGRAGQDELGIRAASFRESPMGSAFGEALSCMP